MRNYMNYLKKMLISIGVLCSALVSSLPAIATPIIGIGSMYDVLTPSMQSLTKRIYNTGDSTAFVRVELLEIHPGDKDRPEERPQKEVTGNKLEQDRLIVTPQRLIIPPAGFQSVRILWPGERGKEKYFRVRFTPVMPEADDNFGLDKNTINDYQKNTLHAGLNVLTGYGSVVIIQPEKPLFNTVIENNNSDVITIHNNGSATVSLDNIRQCRMANTDCGSITREFVLPGRNKKIDKKSGYKTNFTLIEGNDKRVLNY
ncbi:hypothetical protein LU604_25255 [Erwinia tracheiphila]|uniref:Molecular chaperone n=2 Tax=Erwinia tracheiphila TaxID=65700 RepID=A0A345CWI0_9GAMM|nr:hypothetical protein [Erwinia tracheiphila]AXF77797.1 hypothetical protein AV903_19920 [Erwinia tracheiphila]UIA85834.1 hypothetical protein LU604_25255 [Erwinia tracheiphila]UIA94355.1 hypothetical protein LU632_24720 [Erwinia tracheiphila]